MRAPARSDRVVQALLAALLLVPLACAFGGRGSWGEVWGSLPDEPPQAASQRRLNLISAAGRSGWIGLGATGLALALGVPAAWALSRRRRGPVAWAVCALPLALAPSVAVSGWLHWAAPGEVASAFRLLPPGMTGPGPLFSVPGAALVLGLGLWPLVAFEAHPAFLRARGEPYAAALVSGTPARAFFRVILPLARGELAAGALLVFLLAASDFTVSSLLLVRTLPVEINDYLSLDRPASAAWATLPLALVTLVLASVLARGREKGWSTGDTAEPAQAGSAGGRACGAALALGLLLGFVLPLAGCVAGAFPPVGEVGLLERFERGWTPLEHGIRSGAGALAVSLRLALAAALLAWCAGALRVACWPERPARPLRWAALVLLVVPGALLAGGLLAADLGCGRLLDYLAEPGTWRKLEGPPGMLLACGYLLRFLYLPLRLAEEGLAGLDASLLESAELAGHGRFSRGFAVALPLVRPHLLGAAALVFVLALGELAVSDKLAPPQAMPASVWLFQQQHYGYTEAVFGLSLLLGLTAAAALLGAGFLARARGRSAGC